MIMNIKLYDNEKYEYPLIRIKDDGDFYKGSDLLWEVEEFHKELKEMECLD